MMKLKVCMGTACNLKGSCSVVTIFQQSIQENKISDRVEVLGNFCLGNCARGVSVMIDNSEVYSVSPANAKEFFREKVIAKL